LADVLISPRIIGSNTPLKIYTYLRSGKPIIATNLCTHTQVLNSTVAVLVHPEPAAMAKGILTVLHDPLLSKRIGQNALSLFKEKYSFDNFVDRTRHILQMAIE